MSDEEESTCYSGDQKEAWIKAVHDLNIFHETVLPKVWKKGQAQEWTRVDPNFPAIDNFEFEELNDGYNAIEFCKQEAGNIDRTKGTRIEKSALDIIQIAEEKKFMKIFNARKATWDTWMTLAKEYDELPTREYNDDVDLMKLDHEAAEPRAKPNIQNQITKRCKEYRELKARFEATLKLFKQTSECVAKEEGRIFNEQFNKNQYINYFVFEKEGFKGNSVHFKTYLKEQEKSWKAIISYLNGTSIVTQQAHHQSDAELTRQEKIASETTRFQNMLRSFRVLLKQANDMLVDAELEEVEVSRKKLEKRLETLEELIDNPDVDISEEERQYVISAQKLLHPIKKKEKELKEKESKEKRKEELNLAANIKSMPPSKLRDLTGFDDFLAWEESQEQLNTHTNPYKKGNALYQTLKDPHDRRMCQDLNDYDSMMEILKNRYKRPEMLVPRLKLRLKNLPKAYSNKAMFDNMAEIMNTYQRLKKISAESQLDHSMIQELVEKFTDQKREEFLKFKRWERRWEARNSNRAEVNEMDETDEEKRNMFLKFIEEQYKDYQHCNSNMTEAKEKCPKCRHILKFCKCNKSYKHGRVHNVEGQQPQRAKGCPVCGSKELHLSNKDKPTASIGRCPKMKKMNLKERREAAMKHKACFICLNPGHSKDDCRVKNNCYKCDKSKHHPLLCTEPNKAQQNSNRETRNHEEPTQSGDVNFARTESGRTIMVVTEVKIKVKEENGEARYITTNALWDSGANVCIGKTAVMEQTGCKGTDTIVSLTKVGEQTSEMPSTVYNIELLDNENKPHEIQVFSQEQAPSSASQIGKLQMKEISRRFNVPANKINNPTGEIGLLIGMKHFKISPLHDIVKERGELTLFKSRFGKPYVVGGHFSRPKEDTSSPKEIHHVDVRRKQFWDGDQLGLNTDPKCSSCLKAPQCKQCLNLNLPLSYKEQEEGKVIREHMTFDLENKKIRVDYPVKKEIYEKFSPEKSNRFIAEKMQRKVKASLERDGMLEAYTENFLDMEKRGAIKELAPEELREWELKGNPINYCSHHAVLKDSKSTACRSVCNSSLAHNGTNLNALMLKGPNDLSNLYIVLLRFTAKPYVYIGDIKKAYNNIKTSEKDCFLRLLLWYRQEDLKEENPQLRTFGMQVMAFGDTPAQYILERAKEEVSNYARNVMKNERLADDILLKSYVDDIAISFETLNEARACKESLPIAFGAYGFKIKEESIVIAGDGVKQSPEQEITKHFGHLYDPNTDEILLNFVVNFSSKKRSMKTGPNLTSQSDLSDLKMTKRMFMSLLSSQYDPLGKASVFLAKYKIFLSVLFEIPEYDWDVKLKDDHQKQAVSLVKEMIHASENSPRFKRSNRPEGYKLKKYVVFVDASTIALQVVVYGLYESKKDQTLVTSLITAKNRITKNTVPRNELQAIVAGHRIVLNCIDAHYDEPVEEICFLSDSTCSLDALKDAFVPKDIFVINRVSEIRKAALKMNCNVKYYHIATKLNVADEGTRPNCKFEFLSSKEWQEGPEFIKNIDSKATFKFRISKGSLLYEVNSLNATIQQDDEDCIWRRLLKRSGSLVKLLRIYCRIKSVLKGRSFKAKTKFTREEMNQAFLFYTGITQEELQLKQMRTKQLVTFEENGIIYTKMRYPPTIMREVFGKDKLPVIPGKSRLAKLLLLDAHKQKVGDHMSVHLGINQTLVNSRRSSNYAAYITYARQNIKGIVRACTVCRRQAKIPSDAKMAERKGGFGEVPLDGSAFNKIAMDYFGPLWCKVPKARDTELRNTPARGGRGTKLIKFYGMVILCQQTRAVKFYIVEGYDTESFLIAFKIHCAQHGVPSQVLSDPMTAFVAGAKIVGTQESQAQAPEEFPDESQEKSEFEDILEKEFNIDWEFIPPGSQWRDPAERSVKSLKEMMQTIFNSEHHKRVLTFNEYQCLFSECAEILNRRPIEGTLREDSLKFICPNQLLLGRTSKDQPTSSAILTRKKDRLELLENIKSEFWKQLMDVLAADSRLMKYPCWYSQKRQPKPGDIVLVLYKTKVGDGYRIGKINSVNENKRDISCSVSPVQDGSLENFKSTAIMNIPIQRTILIYGKDENEESEE